VRIVGWFTRLRLRWLDARDRRAQSYMLTYRQRAAIGLYKANVRAYERILGPDSDETLRTRRELVDAYSSVGRYDDAIALCETNIRDYERILGPDDGQTLRAHRTLDGLRFKHRSVDIAQSRPGYKRVIQIPLADGTTREEIQDAADRLADDPAVHELVAIGETRRFHRHAEHDAPAVEDERTVEIGHQLNADGGINRMRAVHAAVAIHLHHIPGSARELEKAWDNIGNWHG
jgi:tetratricopeptide (TPR) repeat protein